MPTDTTFLQLQTYNSTTDGSALFSTFRADVAGTSPTSNMNLIDTFASDASGSIVALQAKKSIVSVAATYVSANYYEANSITEITTYDTNQIISLSLDTESDGTVTLNINSLGTKTLNKVDVNGDLANLTGADLKENREYIFRYNGTVWVWINGSSADQISAEGTANNLIMISGCGVMIDSGLETSGSKLIGDSLAITDGLIVTSGSVGVKAGVGLDFSSGSLILADSGVTSGSYNKVIVDDYGRVTSGSVILETVAIAKVDQTTDVTLTNNSWTTVTFDSETYDTASMVNLGTNATIITIPYNGYYAVNAQATFSLGGSNVGARGLYVDGIGDATACQEVIEAVSSRTCVVNAGSIVKLASGATLSLKVYQQNGDNLIDLTNSWLSVALISLY